MPKFLIFSVDKSSMIVIFIKNLNNAYRVSLICLLVGIFGCNSNQASTSNSKIQVKTKIDEETKNFIYLDYSQKSEKSGKVSRISITPFKKGNHLLAVMSFGSDRNADFTEISICRDNSCSNYQTPFKNFLLTEVINKEALIKLRLCQHKTSTILCHKWSQIKYQQNLAVSDEYVKLYQEKRDIHNKLQLAAMNLYNNLAKMTHAKDCSEQLLRDIQYVRETLSASLIGAALSFQAESVEKSTVNGEENSYQWFLENQKYYLSTNTQKPAIIAHQPLPPNGSTIEQVIFETLQSLDYNFITKSVYIDAAASWTILKSWFELINKNAQNSNCPSPQVSVIAQTASKVQDELLEAQKNIRLINQKLFLIEKL